MTDEKFKEKVERHIDNMKYFEMITTGRHPLKFFHFPKDRVKMIFEELHNYDSLIDYEKQEIKIFLNGEWKPEKEYL